MERNKDDGYGVKVIEKADGGKTLLHGRLIKEGSEQPGDINAVAISPRLAAELKERGITPEEYFVSLGEVFG